ncbi:MAG: tol-pal system YbgF family protein [Planctomycetota bacterium]
MRLFGKTPPGQEPPVTELLRHLSHGRFEQALKAFKRKDSGPVMPPHALRRLGRWCAGHDRLKDAEQILRTFLVLYPEHDDRALLMLDLAKVLSGLGKRSAAAEMARQAEEARRPKREEQAAHVKAKVATFSQGSV